MNMNCILSMMIGVKTPRIQLQRSFVMLVSKLRELFCQAQHSGMTGLNIHSARQTGTTDHLQPKFGDWPIAPVKRGMSSRGTTKNLMLY